ncbi:MAG: AsmA family protein [Candidatus Omnitrophota bacterium]
MKKAIIIILIFIAIISALLYFAISYLNTTYLPQVIKTKITEEAAKQLDLNIQIKDIKFNLFKGVELSDLIISSNKNPEDILQIERASASFLIFPFLNQKKIILPSVHIQGPKFDIVRYQDGTFNINNYLPKQIGEKTSASPYSFLIYRIEVLDTQINLIDQSLDPNIKQTLKLNNLGAQIYSGGVNFNLRGLLIGQTQKSVLSIAGNFKFGLNELKTTLELDKIDILPYLVYFKNLPVSIRSLLLNNIKIECSLKNNLVSIISHADITDANLVSDAYLTKDNTLITNATAKLVAKVLYNIKDASKIGYFISLDDTKADLVTTYIPEKVKIDYAKFEISPNKIQIMNSKMNTLETYFSIKGDIINFSNPIYNLKLQSTLDLLIAKDFLRNYFESIDPYILGGRANIDINLSNSKNKDDIDCSGSIDFLNASLKTIKMPHELTAINGKVNFDKNKLDWTNLSFQLWDKLFNSKATIENFNLPIINLELYNDKLNVRTEIISKQKNSFEIKNLEGVYYNSQLDLDGFLDIKENDNYHIDLNIESLIDLDDIKYIDEMPQDMLKKINAKGKCKLNGRIQGNAKYPSLLTAIMSLSSDELKIHNYRLKNLEMQLSQENQQLKIPQLSCNFYGGTIYVNGLIDLEKVTFPYAIKLTGENIDLEKLKLDIPLDDKNLKGNLSSTVILSGQINSQQDIKAEGEFLVKDGYLWNFNPLKKLGDFLFIPKYETLIFKEAAGVFNIYDRKISFENVILSSDIILLSCEGTIDFLGNLNLNITPRPISDITEALDEYEKFFAGIFSEAGGVVSVKITGTVEKPKFEKKIILLQVLDKAKNEVVDKIKAFTDMIFGSPE